jgi:CarD family transcriptional regulator
MAYMPGDTVVHPQHGTATVEGFVVKDLGKGPVDYLQLYVEGSSLKIMVPTDAVEAAGIRNLSTRMEAEGILAILAEPSEVPEGWAERNASTVARLKSHDLAQVSMVVRDLSRHERRRGKPLTMGERNLLEGCLDMVARELSLAQRLSENDARALIVEKSLSEKAWSDSLPGASQPIGRKTAGS